MVQDGGGDFLVGEPVYLGIFKRSIMLYSVLGKRLEKREDLLDRGGRLGRHGIDEEVHFEVGADDSVWCTGRTARIFWVKFRIRFSITMVAPVPRVIVIRHGQTEWSKSGQHTSITDLPLTDFGVMQMRNTGKQLIGSTPFQLISPEDLKYVFISPRKRAKQTADLLLEGLDDEARQNIQVVEDDNVREWEYGDYEGKLKEEIVQLRRERGIDDPSHTWDIWSDGCENGENHQQVADRLDNAIARIRDIHRKALDEKKACDVIVVAHGHSLRCFVARWVGRPLSKNPQLMLDAGGVGVLSYQHHNIEEPAIYLAGAFVVPVEEEGKSL